jgi:uncharacterized circularly permuted ATP-grasp superfamily protein
MTKANEAIRAVFQFIPEIMEYREIIENLLIKYSTEACEEQKQICSTNATIDYSVNYRDEISESINYESIINSPLPDFV